MRRDTKHRDRLAKLLRLARSDANAHEAATAYAHAVAYAARHGLDAGTAPRAAARPPTRPPTRAGEIEDRLIHRAARVAPWRLWLATAIATAHRSDAYQGPGGISVFGRPVDLDAVERLFSEIGEEIDRRGRAYAAKHGRAAAASYRAGMAWGIGERVEQAAGIVARAAAIDAYRQGGETALARVFEHDAADAETLRMVREYGESLDLEPFTLETAITADCVRGRSVAQTAEIGGAT